LLGATDAFERPVPQITKGTKAATPSACAQITEVLNCLSPPVKIKATGSGDSDETVIGEHPDDVQVKERAKQE
jgi:hypothetical protein